ncbi:MAG: hypothetical protein ABH833_03900 [Parcubacteria group bacterium]
MKKTIIACILGLTIITSGCKESISRYKSLVEEKDSAIKTLHAEISDKDGIISELRKIKDELDKEKSQLLKHKEVGEVEITNIKWEEKERDFQFVLSGTIKNTGLAYLKDVTLRVTFLDEKGNPLVAKLLNDPFERGSETTRFYYHAADSLGTGNSIEFKMIIYTHLIHHEGKSRIRQCIKDPKAYELVGFFVSAK